MASIITANRLDIFLQEKFFPLEKKVKIALLVLVFLLPLVLFYFLFFRQQEARLQQLRQQRISLQSAISQAKRKTDQLPRFRQEIEETRKKFEELSVVLPKKQEIPSLLRSISDLGKNAGLEFLSFKPGKEIPQEFYAEIPLDIAIRGPYHNMGFFLDQVSKLDRLVTVNNIKMGAPVNEKGEILLNSTCRLVTYRFTGTPTGKKDDKKKKGKR